MLKLIQEHIDNVDKQVKEDDLAEVLKLLGEKWSDALEMALEKRYYEGIRDFAQGRDLVDLGLSPPRELMIAPFACVSILSIYDEIVKHPERYEHTAMAEKVISGGTFKTPQWFDIVREDAELSCATCSHDRILLHTGLLQGFRFWEKFREFTTKSNKPKRALVYLIMLAVQHMTEGFQGGIIIEKDV